MEPTDLNSFRDEDAALSALFREQAPALPDEGFSARVLAALPPPAVPSASPAPERWPWFAYFGGGLAGAGFAVSHVASSTDLGAGFSEFGRALASLAGVFAEPWLGLAFTLCAISLFATVPFLPWQRRWWNY